MVWLIVLLVLLALIVIALIALYNRFVRYRNRVDNAWRRSRCSSSAGGI